MLQLHPGCVFFHLTSNHREPACQFRQTRDLWVGQIPWRRAQQRTLVFLPGESHGQRNLVGYSPQGHTTLDMTDVTYYARTSNHNCQSPSLTSLTGISVPGPLLKARRPCSGLQGERNILRWQTAILSWRQLRSETKWDAMGPPRHKSLSVSLSCLQERGFQVPRPTLSSKGQI